jgi:hypothetical protein
MEQQQRLIKFRAIDDQANRFQFLHPHPPPPLLSPLLFKRHPGKFLLATNLFEKQGKSADTY